MALELVHRVLVPEVADGQRRPGVVMVHGWLGNENVMSIFERTLPAGVIHVSPRGVLPMGEDNFGWYAGDGDSESFEAGLKALTDFVRGLPEQYPIDPNQVTLVGFSQGAAMSYALLLSEPGLVKAVAGLAGFLPAPARQWTTPGRLSGQPVFIAAGTEDATVPVAQAKAAAEALRTAGAKVDYREYEVGHKMNAQGLRDLRAWLAGAVSGGEGG